MLHTVPNGPEEVIARGDAGMVVLNWTSPSHVNVQWYTVYWCEMDHSASCKVSIIPAYEIVFLDIQLPKRLTKYFQILKMRIKTFPLTILHLVYVF